MLGMDNNVTDAPLMEQNWRKCAIIIIVCETGIQELIVFIQCFV